MDIQRVRVKLFAEASERVDVAPIIDIFARWRGAGDHPASWIDLADYAHVPDGPVALLVGKQGNLGYDLEDGRPGLIWRNKSALEGGAEERVATAVSRGLALFRDLAADERFPAALRLDAGRLAIEFVDRVEVADHEAAEAALGPAVQAVLDRLYGEGTWRATRQADAGRPFGYEAEAASPVSIETLLDRLGGASKAPEERTMELKRVSAQAAADLVANDGYVYIDVRSVGEFAHAHPTASFNVPIMIEAPAGPALIPNREFIEVMAANFERDAKLVVGCRAGGRSLRAAQILIANGYADVIDNYAGFEAGQGPSGTVEPGWVHVGLPVSDTPEPGRTWAELKSKASG